MFESCSNFRCNRHGELPEAHGKPPWRALHLCPVVINWNFVQVNGNGMANVDKMQLQVRHKLLNLRLNFPRQKLQQQRLCNLQLQLAAIVWLAVRLSVSLSVPIPIASFRLFSCPFYRNRGTGKIFWQMNLNNRLQSLREGERGAEAARQTAYAWPWTLYTAPLASTWTGKRMARQPWYLIYFKTLLSDLTVLSFCCALHKWNRHIGLRKRTRLRVVFFQSQLVSNSSVRLS